jgi:hypothetical protein
MARRTADVGHPGKPPSPKTSQSETRVTDHRVENQRARRSRGERRESRAEWRRAWRAVPYADQKRVRDALRRGREVDDPALAPLAVDAAEHRLRGDESFGFPRLQHAIGAVQFVLGLLFLVPAIAERDTVGLVIGAGLLLTGAGHFATRRFERRRLERAAEANRALAGLPRYPDDET